MATENFYSGVALDRAHEWREDRVWYRERLAHPESRFVLLWRDRNLVRMDAVPEAALLRREVVEGLLGSPAEPVLLGLDNGVAYFALDLSHLDEHAVVAVVGDLRFQNLRRVGPVMVRAQGALLAYARGIVHWHSRHRFCGVCGCETWMQDAGFLRLCGNQACGARHFPRTDPAVIMLVVNGDRCLLGRQRSWEPGIYSTLAGFVEPGESLEDSVRREVMEESGVALAAVRYHSSQPWPFPSSLMIGYIADAATEEVRVNHEELDDVRWFSIEEVCEADEGALRLPSQDSIARQLIEDWVGEKRSRQL
jgi:NAD+ diphosphatase